MENTKWTKVKHDVNGNPRYVCHFFALNTKAERDNYALTVSEKYELALKRAKRIGGKKFHNKQFGGGIVFQSYSLDDTESHIKRLIEE